MEALAQHHTNHPVLNIVLGLIATISGVAGMNMEAITMEDLQFYDMVLAMVLKAVSIVSFLVLIALNLGKLTQKVKEWFSKKDESNKPK